MQDFYINTVRYVDGGTWARKRNYPLVISTEPLIDGEVMLALPPVPHDKVMKDLVRYRHTVTRDGQDRMAPNTPQLPVTLAYVNRVDLPDDGFIAERAPIFFGVSGVMDGPERPADDAEDADDEMTMTPPPLRLTTRLTMRQTAPRSTLFSGRPHERRMAGSSRRAGSGGSGPSDAAPIRLNGSSPVFALRMWPAGCGRFSGLPRQRRRRAWTESASATGRGMR